MEWWLILIIIISGFLLLMAAGLPIAFCFILINLVGAFVFWGGVEGLKQLIFSISASVTTFTLIPLPLFVLMGEVIFCSGIAPLMLDALDKWLGRVPGRLGLLAVGGGTLFGSLSGSDLGSVAMLGSVLVPEMERRGYKKPMSLGPILGSAGLAMMIPPSNLAVLVAAIGRVSVGKLLIAIVMPGLLMAGLYATYITLRSFIQPSLAPPYEMPHIPLVEKLAAVIRHVLPLGLIIFMVLGFIFLGITTPTEAAASGALGSFILAAGYKKLNWNVVKKSIVGTIEITGMALMIMTGALAFSQILAFSGATKGLIEFSAALPLSPIFIVIAMQIVAIFLGTVMSVVAVMMIALPIFMPVIIALGFDPVWFAVLFLLNMEMGSVSPPFGLALFVMKGVAPPDTTMGDIYRAALPFLYCDAIAMALIISFPAIALWLPGRMY